MLVGIVIAVSAAAAGALVVLLVALIRHLRLVAASLRQLQDELVPTLQGLQGDAEETRRRLERLARPEGPPAG
ncbi:MAG TPA: hypothetical protein VHL78_09910 [Actinomycetota bacterium]|nr:hypothetical protein [Actinomycetota bacterium]